MTRILIVDDDAQFGAELQNTLTSAGLTAYFHRSPFGTLSAIQRTCADIVLLDVNMPLLDGAMLARMIRDLHGPARVKVILCSNMNTATLDRMARSSGAYGGLTKSMGAQGVLRALELLLQGSADWAVSG